MAPKVEIVEDIQGKLVLGEAPHWDVATQTLYFVDILDSTFHKYVPSTAKHSKIALDISPSFAIPVKGKSNQFVVSLKRDISILTWDGKSAKHSGIEKIAEVDKGTENSLNDAKCDSHGRLWTGTYGPTDLKTITVTPECGKLYSLSKGTLQSHVDKITLSNGLAFDNKLNKFYYVDSFSYKLDAFDYNAANGTISNRKTVFTLEKHGIQGLPDGLTIDVDGNLWLALFGASRVIKIDPKKPETLLQTIDLPAKQITSLSWGGPNLDILFVTSGSSTINGIELSGPEHGRLYKVTGLGTKGLPADEFVL